MDTEIADQEVRPKLVFPAILESSNPPNNIEGSVQVDPWNDWDIELQRRLKSVRREVVLAVSDPIRTAPRYPAGERLVRDMLTAGKRVRILMSSKYADSRDPEKLHAARSLNDHIRVTYTDFYNTMIVDRHEAIVWTCVDGVPRAYLFTGSTLSSSIEQVVSRSWSAGLPLRNHADMRRKDFDSTAIAVMRHLNAGVTDEVAARELSISPRTYRRHVADIMTRLDTATRFQLGARAAELGLLR
ncbi:helix-turn-helix domain-containing protein [Nocardia salmonicida]|uniref:hypothetical protein n=1 Tax=Nocardia salmonicida TaxID=53431 RepID=UPI001C3F546A|nr:hypothetical protein [Nocardia salmonicida]